MNKTAKGDPIFFRRHRSNHSLGRVLHAGFFQLKTGPFNQDLRQHPRFSLVYLLGGTGSYNDEYGVSRRLRPGDLFFTFPDLACAYGPGKNESWSEIFVLFDGPVFDLWHTHDVLDPMRSFFHLHPIPYWEKKIREIVEWSLPPDHRQSLTLVCRFQELLADILLNSHSRSPVNEHFELKRQQTAGNWAQFAAQILEEEKSADVSWERVAHRAGVSYETFRKRFSKHMGISPGRYHMKYLMDLACGLLLSGMVNQQVAETLGFCDEFHFSRRFKQIVGCSPRDYRKRAGVAPV